MRRCCRCVVEFYSLVGPRKGPVPWLAWLVSRQSHLRETAPADKGQLVSVVCDSPACIVVTETVFFLVHGLDHFSSLKTPPQRAGHIDDLFMRKDWPPALVLRRQPTNQRASKREG